MKLAFLGASAIADKIFDSIKNGSKFEIAGIASRSEDRGHAFAKTHLTKYLGSYDQVIDRADIQAVYISALNNEHEALIQKCLMNGKHVLCEKPLVLSSKVAEKLFALAKQKNLVLLEGLMYRFHPQIQKMHELIDSGKFGLPKVVNAKFCFVYDQNERMDRRFSNEGGAAADLGCYLIDFANFIFKSKSLKVTKTQQMRNEQSDHTTNAVIEYENGGIANFMVSTKLPSANTWEVLCENGSLSVNRNDPHGLKETFITIVNDESELSTLSVTSDGTGLEQFVNEFNSFYAAIEGVEPAFITPQESIQNAMLLERLLPQKA